MLINYPKILNIAELDFFTSLVLFLLRSNFVSLYSPGDIIGLLGYNSAHIVLSSVVSVLVLVCENSVFCNTFSLF